MEGVFGIGGGELLVILLMAGIVLGPERLLRAAREVGKLIRNVKSYFGALSSELKAELDVLDEMQKLKNDLTK